MMVKKAIPSYITLEHGQKRSLRLIKEILKRGEVMVDTVVNL